MQRIPRTAVTGGTVAARCKVLTDGKADQGTAGAVMTARTRIMRLRIRAGQRRRIAVAIRAVGR